MKGTSRRARRWNLAGRTLGGLAVLVLLVIAGGALAVQRADAILRQLLSEFAENTVAAQSDSVYHLDVKGIHFNWALRHVGVDSAIFTTNPVVNSLRTHPKPVIRVALYGCTMTGVSLRKIILSQGLSVQRFGCGVVTVDVTTQISVPGPTIGPPSQPPQPLTPFLVLQQGLKLPKSVPRIHVLFIDFPHASLVLTRPLPRGGETRFALEHVEWHVRDLAIDNDDPAASMRPLFSKSVNLSADKFTFSPDTVTKVGVGSMRISITDSTLHLGAVDFGPTVSDARFAHERPYRRDRVRLKAAALTASGIDFGKLMRRGGFYVRHLDLDSIDVDVWSDKRLPPRATPAHHVTPQQWLSESPGGYGIDTLTASGRITYRETDAGHEHDGIMRFTRLRAMALNVSHVVGRKTDADPMRLTTTAYLMNTGRLDASFTVPLDAPAYNLSYTGKLGPMPAESLNGLVQNVFPARITGGQIDSIKFHGVVRAGVTRGEMVPVYHGFAISVTGQGAGGILGAHGGLARFARGIASLYANQKKIRGSNPEKAGAPPRVAPIYHVYSSEESLVSFIWLGLRDPLTGTIQK